MTKARKTIKSLLQMKQLSIKFISFADKRHPEFKYHSSTEDTSAVAVETNFSTAKNVLLPDFKTLITHFSNDDEQTKRFI